MVGWEARVTVPYGRFEIGRSKTRTDRARATPLAARGRRLPNEAHVLAGRKPAGPRAGLPHVARQAFRMLPTHVTLRMRDDVPSLRTVGNRAEGRTDVRCRVYAAGLPARALLAAGKPRPFDPPRLRIRDTLGPGMKAIGARLARAVNRITGRKLGRAYSPIATIIGCCRPPREVLTARCATCYSTRAGARLGRVTRWGAGSVSIRPRRRVGSMAGGGALALTRATKGIGSAAPRTRPSPEHGHGCCPSAGDVTDYSIPLEVPG